MVKGIFAPRLNRIDSQNTLGRRIFLLSRHSDIHIHLCRCRGICLDPIDESTKATNDALTQQTALCLHGSCLHGYPRGKVPQIIADAGPGFPPVQGVQSQPGVAA